MTIPVLARAARLLQWFRRPRVTLMLILVLLVLYTLGLVIPQKGFFDSKEQYDGWLAARPVLGPVLDFLGFTDIYTSPVTLLFLALFYVNLLLVVINRIPLILRKTMVMKQREPIAFSLEDLKRSPRCREFDISGVDAEEAGRRIASFFQRQAWFVRQSDDLKRTLAVRNRFSALGFLLFHLSFLLCLTGGLTIYYTRFSGKVALTEREAFEGDLKQFYAIDRQPKVLRELPELSFQLEKADFQYEDRQPSYLDAVMHVRYGDKTTTEHIGVNQPVKRGAYTLLALSAGVSPLLILRDAEKGTEHDGAWVRLESTEEKADMFRFETVPDLEFSAIFFPDYVVENGKEMSKSLNIVNPAYHITVRQEGTVVAEATIKKGQGMIFGPLMLEFRDLRRWVIFQVVREMGAGPLVVGFALAVIGLTMRLIFYRKEIRICLQDGRMWLDGTSEYYQHSFSHEMDGLAEALDQNIRGAGPEEVVKR